MRSSRAPRRAALALAVAGLALLAPAGVAEAAPGGCAHADATASRANLAQVRVAVRCLVNRERLARGMRKLRVSRKLRRAARRHSKDMVRRRYFDHVSPNGGDLVSRARRTGYAARTSAWRLAENIGWGDGVYATAAAMVRAWMDSPPHRRNILRDEMEHLGVGLAFGTPFGRPGLTGTLLFGQRG